MIDVELIVTGLIGVIGGIATGNVLAVAIGGALFVGGLICTIIFGKAASDLAGEVAATENQIRTVSDSIAECKCPRKLSSN